MTFKYVAITLVCLSLLGAGCARTGDANKDARVEMGEALAQAQCARCHAVGFFGESPLDQAPPFRRLHERYPIEQLAEAFAEGIVVDHTEMPAFELQPREIDALLAYLGSLERGKQKYD